MGQIFTLGDHALTATRTGVLWWEKERLLCVSDMHLGKASRFARKTGGLLPPFETHETLARLAQDIARFDPETVVCLGDSFDDLQALDEVEETDLKSLMMLMAGREWIWIEGNHEAGPTEISGTHLKEYCRKDVMFRHIYQPDQRTQVSGHYHPKGRISAGGAGRSAPCFVVDRDHAIMPAFGTYTGGLKVSDPAIQAITSEAAIGILIGAQTLSAPLSKL